jgi:mediator of RNA polymerase II transcription subunit 8
MAALGLDDDEFKSVEQTLSRLAQLSSSIQSLKMDIIKSNPLPHPYVFALRRGVFFFTLKKKDTNANPAASRNSLQASAQILQRNLQTVLDNLSENSDLFSRITIHPSTNYPGRSQENVLTQLLRKKLEPDVEELVEKGRETARLATPEGIAELQGIWDELRAWTHGRIATYVREEAGDAYTKEERDMGIENVRTGLKRDLEEEEEEDEEDEDDEEGDDEEDEEQETAASRGGGGGPAQDNEKTQVERGPEPETLLWFMARADFEVPRNVEYERKGTLMKGLEGVNIPPEPMQT